MGSCAPPTPVFTSVSTFLHFSSAAQSCPTLQPHGLQHARPPCPSPTPSLLKLTSTVSVMPSNHLILCFPLFLPPSIFPSIRVFSSESALHIRWLKYWSFSFSISPSNEYAGLISFRMDWLDLFAVQGTLKNLLQHHVSWIYVLKSLLISGWKGEINCTLLREEIQKPYIKQLYVKNGKKKKKDSFWRDLFKDFSPRHGGEANTRSEAFRPQGGVFHLLTLSLSLAADFIVSIISFFQGLGSGICLVIVILRGVCRESGSQGHAAAAKSLQLCPTLCDPIDGSPPGSAVPGILQAGTLEWVAISFSSA